MRAGGKIIRFPPRRAAAIFVINDDGNGLLVLAPNGHGWIHSDAATAIADARWLSANFGGLPIRGVPHAG
jgi:hypothetical protein